MYSIPCPSPGIPERRWEKRGRELWPHHFLPAARASNEGEEAERSKQGAGARGEGATQGSGGSGWHESGASGGRGGAGGQDHGSDAGGPPLLGNFCCSYHSHVKMSSNSRDRIQIILL